MSNFKTFTPHVGGQPGLAPIGFEASTEDDLATITAVGYLNDKEANVRHNDYFYINYDGFLEDRLTYTMGVFRVQQTGTVLDPVFSLVAFP